MKLSVFPFACCSLLLGGCAVGPRYTPPQSAMADGFAAAHPATQASRIVPGQEAVDRWWFVFGDDELNSLIARGVRGNLDLREAVSRVRQARAERAAAQASLWPQLNLSAGYNRGHGSENVQLPFGNPAPAGAGSSTHDLSRAESTGAPASSPSGSAEAGAPAGPPLSPLGQGGLPGITTNLYQVGLDAAWELDVFGGNRRGLDAADAGVAVTEEMRRAVLVSLLAEVATTYFELRTNQQRLQVAAGQLAAQRDELGYIEAKFHAGFATDLDVAEQAAQVATTEAIVPALETAGHAAEHALAFLLGVAPDALDAELAATAPLPPLPATVPVGLPSDLLRHRPDIRRAERQLAQATAQVGVATADLLPKFDLTGSLGLDSSAPKNLGEWASHYYSITPGIRWPVLDWGRLRAGLRVQTERQQQAFVQYEKAVAQALREVEDALVRYGNDQRRRASLATAADASRRGREIAQQRFKQGVTDLFATLETQRAMLQSQDALAQSDGELRRDLIALYKALGGGWDWGE